MLTSDHALESVNSNSSKYDLPPNVWFTRQAGAVMVQHYGETRVGHEQYGSKTNDRSN